MSLPTPADVHVDAALTDISVGYIQNASSFIASRVFPNVPVMKQSDKYFVYNRGDWFRDEVEKRAPGAESAGSGYRLSTDNYFADVWALHKMVPWQVSANEDAVLRGEEDAAEFVMLKHMIKRERLWAANYMAGGVWTGGDVDGVASSPTTGQVLQWNDAASTPIENVRFGQEQVVLATGYKPNVLAMGHQVFTQLADHPDIVDRIKYSGGVGPASPAVVTLSAMAALFDVDRIEVSMAVYNTADEGLDQSNAFCVGKQALLCYVPPNPGRMTPSAGYTFSWQGYLNQSNEFGVATQRIENSDRKATKVEAEMAFDQKLVASDLGYFFDDIVA